MRLRAACRLAPRAKGRSGSQAAQAQTTSRRDRLPDTEWKLDAEGRPHSDLAFDRDRSIVALDDRLHDREAEARALNCLFVRSRCAEEAREQLLLVRQRDPHAGVGDEDLGVT